MAEVARITAIYLAFLRMLRGRGRLVTFVCVANIVTAILTLAEPILLARVIDDMTGSFGDRKGWLPSSIIAWALTTFAALIANLLAITSAEWLAQRARAELQHRALTQVLSLSTEAPVRTQSAKVLLTIDQAVAQAYEFWASFFKDQSPLFTVYILTVPIAFWLNWQMATAVFSIAATFATFNFWVIAHSDRARQRLHEQKKSLSLRIRDLVTNAALITSFECGEYELTAINRIAETVVKREMPIQNWAAFAQIAATGSSALALVAVILIGAFLYRLGHVTLGEIIGFISITGLLIYRLETSTSFIRRFAAKAGVLNDLLVFLDTRPDVADHPDALDLSCPRGDIVFRDVSFGFPDADAVVDGVSFEIAAGESVALVGVSGSGKSTIIGLLQRLWDPQSGSITLDGVDLKMIKLASLRRQLSVMPQDASLLNRSVLENIMLGDTGASSERVTDLAARIGVPDALMEQHYTPKRHPEDQRRGMSGGERQRVGLVRSLLKNASILILDEATSALDSLSERQVQTVIDGVRGERTTIVVAHRLATIRNVDKVIVLDKGRIVEQGSYAKLSGAGGHFAAMLKAFEASASAPVETEKA